MTHPALINARELRLVTELAECRKALVELVDAAESIAVYPEGSVGFESLAEAITVALAALARQEPE